MSEKTVREEATPAGGTQREAPSATTREGAAGSAAGWDQGFPAELASRFEVVRAFDAAGNEADAYLVRGPEGLAFAKVYRRGIKPNSSVLTQLNAAAPEHVIRLIEANVEGERAYELLEYAELGTLGDLLRAEGPKLKPDLARTVLVELVDALAHVHALNIEHRDLKPENVLVRSRQPLDLVLTDFGIASTIAATQHFTSRNRTARYSPPEALEGAVHRTRWDYWSLGIVLVEILSGQNPFEGQGDQTVGHRLISRPTDELSEAVKDPAWRKLCRGLLRREPTDRWDAANIRRWLANPDDPALVVREESNRRPPLRFLGKEFESPSTLAEAFAADWSEAIRFWKGQQSQDRLLNWLRDDLGETAKATELRTIDQQANAGLDLQLFLVLQSLSPSRQPSFQGRPVTLEALRSAGDEALQGDADAAGWLRALHENNILSLAGRMSEGSGLQAAQTAWNDAVTRFRALEADVPGGMALSGERLSSLLAAATPGSPALKRLRDTAAAAATDAARSRLWFSGLGQAATSDAAGLLAIVTAAPVAEAEVGAARQARRERLDGLWGYLSVGAALGLTVGLIWWFAVAAFCQGGHSVCEVGWPHASLQLADMLFLAGAVVAALALLGAVHAKISKGS